MKIYREFASSLALKAGNIIKQNFALGMQKDWKDDQTPLTVTDTKINKLVIEEIQKSFPDHSILGEEESAETDSEFVWVCDPLDGTVPFSHGYPTSVFSLALVKNSQPILGVVYDPYQDRLVIGEKGQGVTLNGQAIGVSSEKVINGKSMINLDCDYKLSKLREGLLKSHNCYVTTFYSAVYAGFLVAAGEFMAEVYEYNSPWDGAAVKVIVEEAGGRVTDIDGNDQRYDRKPINGFVASNGLVHEEILRLIKEAKNKKH